MVQQILDSLPAEVQLDELPEWHLDILALRRMEMEASPGAGKPWREALAKFGRTS
ncbi:MAG: addiction module protein [Planctomycetes bacterium]|nr:addiction module protein [Planctomycetota bacterium]